MPYVTPKFQEILDRQLRDARALDHTAPTDEDSDLFARAACTASAVEGLYDHQNWLARQLLPDTADIEYLEYHAGLRGMVRKPAVKASGTATFSGAPGTVLPSGAAMRSDNGTLYLTSAEATIGENGVLSVRCASSIAGAVPDLIDGAVTLQQPPTGIFAVGVATVTGGAAPEGGAALLARLVGYMPCPPGGGNAADYKRWAKSITGVGEAYVHPLRRGPGTVDIIITGVGVLASPEVVTAAQQYIDAMRPVTAKQATVLAAEAFVVDVRLKIAPASGFTLQTLTPGVHKALVELFDVYEPGAKVIISALTAAVSGVTGVSDVVFASPAQNIATSAIQWPRLGALTLEAL